MLSLQSPHIEQLLLLALEEDCPFGDVTSESVGGLPEIAQAEIVTKEPCRVCGTPLIPPLSALVDDTIAVDILASDGSVLEVGGRIATLVGPLEKLLIVERVALNFLQHLSGISTHVAALVASAGELPLLDTRKTLPGYRELEKYAVRIGGGVNHRSSLSDQVLIKDNHVDGAGLSAAELVERSKENRPEGVLVEVEVRTFAELEDVVRANPDVVLLDNMDGDLLRRSIAFVRERSPQLLIEISGNINEKRFPELRQLYQEFGRIRASMGYLTYGAKHIDLSMKIAVK